MARPSDDYEDDHDYDDDDAQPVALSKPHGWSGLTSVIVKC